MCLRITSARTSEHTHACAHARTHTHSNTSTESFYYRPPGSGFLFEAHDPSLGKLHAFSPKRCTMTMYIQHAGECCIFTWTSPPPVLGPLPADVTGTLLHDCLPTRPMYAHKLGVCLILAKECIDPMLATSHVNCVYSITSNIVMSSECLDNSTP